ncbi:hypothetical protein BT96DRAFT_979108 [Gymnopus androsaceus JB14]|uniref:Uncharacterized protein n=1 Tax=Gymnopus androsaceus JB14 TaxID=1447944 RepID=A0A6A4H5M4_9AGAR|nr:hypothetical protein BT96DRAFT_979108 [Gymnopus androsaceus JB14]
MSPELCAFKDQGPSIPHFSFTKPPVPQTFEAMADTLAKRLVNWLLEQQDVFRGLGFSKSPIVINLDQFPYETIREGIICSLSALRRQQVHTSQALLCPLHEKCLQFLPDLDAI